MVEEYRIVPGPPRRPAFSQPIVVFKGRVVPFPFNIPLLILFILLLPIVALVSIPATKIHFVLQRRRESRLLARLRPAGRVISWAEARSLVEQRRGFFVSEHLSTKGPHRLWWTSDDIPALSPVPCCFDESPDRLLHLDNPFHSWCRATYTDVSAGSARWVDFSGVSREECEGAIDRLRLLHLAVTTSYRPRP